MDLFVVDKFTGLGFIFVFAPLAAWYLLCKRQYELRKEGTLRIQVLSTRTALFLPMYSTLIWISLLVDR
jgi:hypothetical protein